MICEKCTSERSNKHSRSPNRVAHRTQQKKRYVRISEIANKTRNELVSDSFPDGITHFQIVICRSPISIHDNLLTSFVIGVKREGYSLAFSYLKRLLVSKSKCK